MRRAADREYARRQEQAGEKKQCQFAERPSDQQPPALLAVRIDGIETVGVALPDHRAGGVDARRRRAGRRVIGHGHGRRIDADLAVIERDSAVEERSAAVRRCAGDLIVDEINGPCFAGRRSSDWEIDFRQRNQQTCLVGSGQIQAHRQRVGDDLSLLCRE